MEVPAKLIVKCFPRTTSESEVEGLLRHFGAVEVRVLTGGQHTTNGKRSALARSDKPPKFGLHSVPVPSILMV